MSAPTYVPVGMGWAAATQQPGYHYYDVLVIIRRRNDNYQVIAIETTKGLGISYTRHVEQCGPDLRQVIEILKTRTHEHEFRTTPTLTALIHAELEARMHLSDIEAGPGTGQSIEEGIST